ncbi:MAG: M56 family metallopeptidase [Acidobacteriota bacterium]
MEILSVGWVDPFALVLRITYLFAMTGLVGWTLRRRAASLRHLLWTTTFLILLALPAAVVLKAAPASAGNWTEGANPTGPWSAPGPAEPTVLANALADPAVTTPLLALWAVGCLAALLSLGVGWLRFASWARSGCAVRSPSWNRDLAALRRRLGIRRSVEIRESDKIDTPMVGGLLRPIILVPAGARDWPGDRRWAVLAHELSHVSRLDPLRQLLCSLALAVYWFHPLSWWAARASTESREQACDEAVLRLGARPSDYARHLFELARRREQVRALALPMVQASQLERRILAILEPRRPSRSLLLATLACTLLIGHGIAAAVTMPSEPPPPFATGCPMP